MRAEWVATYRLQLHAGFPFAAAREALPYLKRAGISHLYLSPCLQAVPGSQHGYDVTDPTRISSELGGEEGWGELTRAAREQGMSVLLDIVPNHMYAGEQNPWWDNMLEHGLFSPYAEYFDVRVEKQSTFRLHVCALARPYGEALEAGELKLTLKHGRPRVTHYDNSWPLNPASWGRLLGATDPCFARLGLLLSLPKPSAADQIDYEQCLMRAQTHLERVAGEGTLEPKLRALEQNLDSFDALLQRQVFVLHGWKLAGELTNYRRFFDIGSLSGVRTELPQVMDATHARIRAMIEAGQIDGLRVDHPDGLRAPLEYFERLRSMLPDGRIFVEKILESEERLPQAWPIDGTVGYDFLSRVNRLWMDDSRADSLTATYQDFTGHSVNLGKLTREMKRSVIDSTFALNMDELAQTALALARARRGSRDLSPRQLREALARLTVAMPVYRTYRTARGLDEEDRRIINDSLHVARLASSDLDASVFDFLGELMCRAALNDAEADFVAKWQQLSPAVMAKGVEDTAFYLFDRLLSCNEVGSHASQIGISPDKFHEYCHYLSERWPNTMLATSTHDNKRSEDVRTRISVLSEIPERWAEALHQWSQLNAAAWQNRVPDRHAEYLLYQTLVGAWPLSRDRCWQYMLKACREAGISTSWHEPNAAYESKIEGFVDGLYASPEFLSALAQFVEPLILPGRINSLAQTLIKCVAPGVPDFYQGTELWDLSLVDPDNRRPVDFLDRARLLERASEASARDTLADWDTGLPKLWLIARLLEMRRLHPQLFDAAAKYQPLVALGSHLGKLLAFRRGENLIAVVPRLTLSLGDDWADTRLPLPGGEWRNCLTGAPIPRDASPAVLFEDFPVALLLREGS